MLRITLPLAAMLLAPAAIRIARAEADASGTLRFPSGASMTMYECDSAADCATWVFTGNKGHGQWSDGSIADLSVGHSDGDAIIIIRNDSASSPTHGQRAIYQGTLQGNRIDGVVLRTWPGHLNNGSIIENWYAVLGDKPTPPPTARSTAKPENLPAELHVCSGGCGSLTWHDGHYVSSGGSPMIITHFTDNSIVLLRIDGPNQWFHNGLAFLYRGDIGADRSTAHGTQTNIFGDNGGHIGFSASWGAQLSALPSQGRPPQQASPAPPSQQSAAAAPIPNTDARVFQLPAETKSSNLQALPARMTVCEVDWCAEGGAGPALWTFSGSTGHGSWGENTEATLTVEKFDSTGVVIKRMDTAGKTKGLTVTLRGQLSDRYIVGDEYLSWPGHWENGKSFAWSAQAALPATGRRVSIKGNWQAPNNWRTQQGRPIVMRIEEDGDRVTGWLLGENGTPQFEGHFASDTVIEGRSRDDRNGGEVRWVPQKLYLDDPDHLAQRDDPALFAVFRASADTGDLPCDRANSFHATPNFAFLRGRLALSNHKDFANAACWLRIAALQGHARAQAMLASQIYNGQGVTQSDSLAFEWARSSAERNDILGEMLLAALYKEGKGVAADPKQYEYWNSRVKQRRADQLWALLDKKTPIGLTGREAIGAAFSMATTVADSTDWLLGHECRRWEDGHCIQ
jgi:hypothetical protein